MSETKFTPGPWEWNVDYCVILSSEPVGVIAQTDRCYSADEVIANGLLIAAAPELYAALEVFAKSADQYTEDTDEDQNDIVAYMSESDFTIGDLRRARAALKKARGE